MTKNTIYKLFREVINVENILIDEPMKKHTSFKIGGCADIMVLPENIQELVYTIKTCRNKDIPYYIIGNGTNVLVSDKGIRGVVIKILENFNNVEIKDNLIKSYAGALLSFISKKAFKKSLAGLEFASGIPGTVGGAVAMNAGAYGGQMKDVVTKVKCLDKQNNIVEFNSKEMDFEYRKSKVENEGLIVLEVEMKLKQGNSADIIQIMKELKEKRVSKQPLNLPSGGSIFKRPEGYFAGKLIEDSGLKGLRYGDAQVSDKHCGFIVNLGDATSHDVINLIRVVQKVVNDKFGVKLEPELKFIGEE